MKRLRPAIVLVSVALFAALIAHVVIDILGDFMLAHDTYDDIGHSSRVLVASAALTLALAGVVYALQAAIREARGCENAFCSALARMLPKRTLGFLIGAGVTATAFLCLMESCDAVLAGQHIDDLGDLFGGSIAFGGTIVALTAILMSLITLTCLRRLARARSIVGVVAAFLRRAIAYCVESKPNLALPPRPIFRSARISRRIAGRAPPLLPFEPTL